MIKFVLTAALVAVLTMIAGLDDAEARRRTDSVWTEQSAVPFWEEGTRNRRTKQVRQSRQQYEADDEDRSERRARRGRTRTASVTESWSGSVGSRPGRWCGWYMRTRHGGGPQYNLARNWRNRGTPTGPQVGAIVVWNSHVGEITGRASNGQWIVLSGNDGGRVRERPRSVAGASFRML